MLQALRPVKISPAIVRAIISDFRSVPENIVSFLGGLNHFKFEEPSYCIKASFTKLYN